jgi:3-hydroxyacyl-CoA dehydrogenase
LLHCDAVQAHAELYTGLVEVGVGLIPGWGGCKEYLARCLRQPKQFGGPMPPVVKAFQTIGMATVSKSAFEAKALMFLSENDGITMNKERLLADAKARALRLVDNYNAPEAAEYKLPGKTAKTAMTIGLKGFRMVGKATEYDVEVGKRLAHILSGGDCDITQMLSEDDMLNLELQGFLDLVQQTGTLARLEHMLKTGKPLRN